LWLLKIGIFHIVDLDLVEGLLGALSLLGAVRLSVPKHVVFQLFLTA